LNTNTKFRWRLCIWRVGP